MRQFFAWLTDDGEISTSLMAKMRPPTVPEQPVPELTVDELRALLRTVEKAPDFLARRDAALIRLFVDTGARLAEISGLGVADVNPDVGTIKIMGKGAPRAHPAHRGKNSACPRSVPRGPRPAPRPRRPPTVARHKGPMTSYGIAEAIKRRAAQAGIGGSHLHMLRHCAAHYLRLAVSTTTA